jgi:hypothetical protein
MHHAGVNVISVDEGSSDPPVVPGLQQGYVLSTAFCPRRSIHGVLSTAQRRLGEHGRCHGAGPSGGGRIVMAAEEPA